ncbi:MAG TPA: MBL fold metallo-hydrolase [Chitinophagaceae bacterium]|nr:MBL fold metallo-hydrolase [Chitinophagaceae bacterium]
MKIELYFSEVLAEALAVLDDAIAPINFFATNSIKQVKSFSLLFTMPLYITALASGSNGNCYYVGTNKEAILIDVGVCCKEVENRMKLLRLPLHQLKAIFISHEHTDHIKGVRVLSKKYNIPVYITTTTLRSCRLKLEKHLIRKFSWQQPTAIGDLQVKAFGKQHDAAEPCSFVVSFKDLNVGVFTDIGTPCSQLIHYFKQCHAAFLESNYDENMLESGSYPYYLKSRIRGGKGHLSNTQALEIFRSYRSPQLSYLLLSHLSKNNNCPQLVNRLFQSYAGPTKIVVTSREEATPIYVIEEKNVLIKPARPKIHLLQQLSFHFDEHIAQSLTHQNSALSDALPV